MPANVRFGSCLGVFGKPSDRFVSSGYKKERSVSEMIAIAGDVPDLEGVELMGGVQITEETAAQRRAELEKAGLELSCVTPDIWASAQWGCGSLAARDERVRRAAVAEVKRGMDLAATLGSRYVDVWLAQDGYDYPFQGDFLRAWDWMIEGLQECSEHRQDVTVLVEYKAKEPRTHCYVANVGKTLLLLEEVDKPNTGILLDVGHGWAAAENVAESVALMKRFGDRLKYVHMNDNYGLWDDDMMVSSVHFSETLELMYWLEATDFDGWLVTDIFPYRDDSVGVVTESLAWMKSMRAMLRRIGLDKVREVIEGGDATGASKMVREALFGST